MLLEGYHLQHQQKDVPDIASQQKITILHCRMLFLLDIAVGQRSLYRKLLIELSIRALQVSLVFAVDCDLAVVGYGLRIDTQALLRGDKDEFSFKYITILSVLVEVSLVKGQELPEDHEDFLLRDG